MFLPPGPITNPIKSLLISRLTILGAWALTESFGLFIVSSSLFNISNLPFLAWPSASIKISYFNPLILISIWHAVIPSFVPVTLKSISPRWSSSPKISDNTAYLSPSVIKPIAIPETLLLILIPASINARDPAQTEAIEDDPLDSKISETILTVYGQSDGITFFRALWARFPWPTSLLEVPLNGLASPVENGGKL